MSWKFWKEEEITEHNWYVFEIPEEYWAEMETLKFLAVFFERWRIPPNKFEKIPPSIRGFLKKANIPQWELRYMKRRGNL